MKNIWMFWKNPPGQTDPPAYIKLCMETVNKHCNTDFDIHLVTTENVKHFLPNISPMFFKIAQINNLSNYLRYHLLCEHGGIWLDADLILFQSLKPLLNLLKGDINLIATASPTLVYGEPECGFLLSTQRGGVISKAVDLIEYAINLQPPGHIFKWGSMGPGIIRQAVKGKRYHHLDCRFLSPIPSWEAFRFEGKEKIKNICIENAFGVMLFNEMFRQANSPVLRMNREQLLTSPTLLGQIFRQAINGQQEGYSKNEG
jgi:mannosyltransferase OCH1-like enzyme